VGVENLYNRKKGGGLLKREYLFDRGLNRGFTVNMFDSLKISLMWLSLH